MSISSLSYIHQIDETMSEKYCIPTSQDKVQRYVVKFVDNLKQLSPTYRFKLFSKRIHSIVADKAAYFAFYLNKGMVSQQPTQFQRLKYHLKNSPSIITQLLFKLILYLKSKEMVLNPGGSFLCYWESLVLFLSILNIMYIPLSVCFSIDKSDLLITHILLGYLPSLIFLLDMAMSFFKAYYEKGVMRNTKSEMFWHYVKGDLFFDICVVLPFFLEAFGVKSTNYFMLLRVTRIKRTFDTIEETFNFQEKSAALFELVYLICFVVMASHFCACMFHYIAYLERQHGYEYTWQDAQHIADAHWTTKYIYSLYFTAITSMTVGYGDVVPVTNPERVFVTVITYLVTGVFGYVISSIGSIVFKLKELDNQYQQRIRIINKIIHARGLPNELQFKVRTFFEYYFQVQQQQQVNFEELMAQMNHNLREEVQHELYFKYLNRSKFLRENFSQEFVRSLCFKLREQTFYPDDEVVQMGKIHNQLIIILSGSVQSFVPGKGKSSDIKLQDYEDGLLIGEREFFLKEQVQFGVKALSFVQTASLSDEDFFQMLSQHPKDQEKFCFLKDQYLFGDSTDFGIACEVCSSNHALNECPFSFVYMNRGKCINVVALSEDNRRKRKRRRIKAQHHVDRLAVKQSAVRHMLKEAMVNKEYNNSAFHRAYLEKIGFTPEQISHLKKTLLTSELRSYLKHQNKDKRDNKVVQQEMEDMLMHQSQDADEDIMMKFKSYNNTEPTELRISFDIDKLDSQDREIYYPDDNVNKVIERLNLRNILINLADMSPVKEKHTSNEVAGKLIKLFMGRPRRYGRR